MKMQSVKTKKSNISDYTPYQTMDAEDTMENTRDKSEDSVDLSKSRFVPLTSCISPTLGRLVSPFQPVTRQEVPTTAKRKAEISE